MFSNACFEHVLLVLFFFKKKHVFYHQGGLSVGPRGRPGFILFIPRKPHVTCIFCVFSIPKCDFTPQKSSILLFLPKMTNMLCNWPPKMTYDHRRPAGGPPPAIWLPGRSKKTRFFRLKQKKPFFFVFFKKHVFYHPWFPMIFLRGKNPELA